MKTTVMMCVHGTHRKYLRESILSVLSQTEPKFKFLVILDGKDDALKDVIMSYDFDPRLDLKVLKQNLGLTEALNLGMQFVDTPYIMRQDADDVSMPNRMQVLTDWMDTHPRCGAVGDNYAHIDQSGKILHINTADPENAPESRFNRSGLSGTVAGGGTMLRTNAVNEVGGWRFKRAQDCYLYHALLSHGWSVQSVKHTLYHWRRHPGQITDAHRAEQLECVKQILEIFG